MSSLALDYSTASILLWLVAPMAYKLLWPIATDKKSAPASAIAVQLWAIAGYSTRNLSQLPDNTERLCARGLEDLLKIFEWPSPSTRTRPRSSAQDLFNRLMESFNGTRSQTIIENSVIKFFRESSEEIDPLLLNFRVLWESLSATADLKPLDSDVYPHTVHAMLLGGIQSQSHCESVENPVPHLTRLCLSSGFRSTHDALFDLIAAHSDALGQWQEMTISVPILESGREAQQSPNSPRSGKVSVCDLLGARPLAKVLLELEQDSRSDPHDQYHLYNQYGSKALDQILTGSGVPLSQLLGSSELTIEHKIRLSYTIARAFWQFYNSDLMATRWTSNDILFMQLDENETSECKVSLRAFVSFPFGSKYEKSPEEFCNKAYSSHPYPRILFLGIVLLEIGLGQVLESESSIEPDPVRRINQTLRRANAMFRNLRKTQWPNSQWKERFVMAVDNCLDPQNFNESSRRSTPARRNDEGGSRNIADMQISHRREALYGKVVAPLRWLATRDLKFPEDEVPTISLNRQSRRESIASHDYELSRSWAELRNVSTFLSEDSNNTSRFITDLPRIAGHIELCRKRANIDECPRIAILDTGCKTDMPFFSTSRRPERLSPRNWKDFVAPESLTRTDYFGHGTLMTKLIMHVAPTADIYLARVAKNGDDLKCSGNKIAEVRATPNWHIQILTPDQAIRHAGLSSGWKVDIISMSFDLSDETYHTEVSNAIEEVTKDRNGSVLFFAAAGNSHVTELAFPASHDHVIPIYATNSFGDFLGSNAVAHREGSERLGTYGRVPSCFYQDIEYYFERDDLNEGTSVATAVAVGTAAMMLSYTKALHILLSFRTAEQMCADLYTKRGMEEMLSSMATGDHARRQFINPIWFWSKMQEHKHVFVKVCSALDKMRSRQ